MTDFLITAQDMPDSVDESERAKVGRKGGFLLGVERSALLVALDGGLAVEAVKTNPNFEPLVAMKLITSDGGITSYARAVLSREPYVARHEPVEMTKQKMLERVQLLAEEMDANDEENRLMQDEITALYAKIDATA